MTHKQITMLSGKLKQTVWAGIYWSNRRSFDSAAADELVSLTAKPMQLASLLSELDSSLYKRKNVLRYLLRVGMFPLQSNNMDY